jgi:ankyrin repeat protein
VTARDSSEVSSIDLLERILGHPKGIDYVNKADYRGVTPLHVAASCGDSVGVELLLRLSNGHAPRDLVEDQLMCLANEANEGADDEIHPYHSAEASVEYDVLVQVDGILREAGGLFGSECRAVGISTPARTPVELARTALFPRRR